MSTPITPRAVFPWWDRALAICLRDHRLPSRQIPCVPCQKAAAEESSDD
jgi:hypothetical protein